MERIAPQVKNLFSNQNSLEVTISFTSVQYKLQERYNKASEQLKADNANADSKNKKNKKNKK